MWGVGVAGLVVVEWRGGDRMWAGVGRMLGGGGLVVIEMVGGCRIRGGGD